MLSVFVHLKQNKVILKTQPLVHLKQNKVSCLLMNAICLCFASYLDQFLVKWLFEYRFDSNRFIFNLVYIEWWIPRKMLWIPPHLIMGGRKQKLLGISQLKTLWKHVWSKFPRENVLVRALQKKGWKNIRVRFHNLTGLKYEKAQLKNRYDSLRKD